MVRKSYTPEQIINKLREAEILLNQGAKIGEACRKIGVTEQTYYRWRKEYGGMRIEQAKRLKYLDKEKQRNLTSTSFCYCSTQTSHHPQTLLKHQPSDILLNKHLRLNTKPH